MTAAIELSPQQFLQVASAHVCRRSAHNRSKGGLVHLKLVQGPTKVSLPNKTQLGSSKAIRKMPPGLRSGHPLTHVVTCRCWGAPKRSRPAGAQVGCLGVLKHLGQQLLFSSLRRLGVAATQRRLGP